MVAFPNDGKNPTAPHVRDCTRELVKWWMVIGVGSSADRRFVNEGLAELHAMGLAKQNPGEVYQVIMSASAFVFERPAMLSD